MGPMRMPIPGANRTSLNEMNSAHIEQAIEQPPLA